VGEEYCLANLGMSAISCLRTEGFVKSPSVNEYECGIAPLVPPCSYNWLQRLLAVWTEVQLMNVEQSVASNTLGCVVSGLHAL
jgi:hypothetical protein